MKNKKVLIIILVCILIIAVLILGIILFLNSRQESINKDNNQNYIEENLEDKFRSIFSNTENLNQEDEVVSTVYKIQEINQGKYDVNVHIPAININTKTVKNINNEIIINFAVKLQDILQNSTAHSIYNIDYIVYTNNTILSLIIKATLKEGSNPQRLIVQTYNYDIEDDKILSLEELINLKQIDKNQLQTQIINYIRDRGANSKVVAEQGYNVYVRDIRSEEYLIDKIKNYYLGEDGSLYIVFAYGNTNFTETIDIIKK